MPTLYGVRPDVLAGQGQFGCNAKEGIRPEVLEGLLHQGIVPIGGFHKKLGLAEARALALQPAKLLPELLALGGEVAVKTELLAVHARGDQRQQYGGRPYQWPHRDVQLMGGSHQHGSGVRHRRAAGLREQPHIVALPGRFQQAENIFRRSVFVEHLNLQLPQRPRKASLLKKSPGRFGPLGNEVGKPVGLVHCVLG